MTTPPSIEGLIANRLVEFYRRDRCVAAKLCDEQIDRSGNLLGWLRELDLVPPRTPKAAVSDDGLVEALVDAIQFIRDLGTCDTIIMADTVEQKAVELEAALTRIKGTD